MIKAHDVLKNKKLIAYGVSLGGIAAVDLASKKPVDCLIVESTFTSAKDMAKRIYPFVPSFLIGLDIHSDKKIKLYDGPKLIIHSPADQIVPYALGRKLFDVAEEPKWFVDIQGGHNDAFSHQDVKSIQSKVLFLKEEYAL